MIIKKDIKNIMIVHGDMDFIRVWDWIGKITLQTLLNNKNVCGGLILEDSDEIEQFILSLLPTAIEFIQYREDKNTKNYRVISKDELERLVSIISNVEFKYNFEKNDEDYINGGSELLIIDIENNKSYIR